jgi:hypothetical protein
MFRVTELSPAFGRDTHKAPGERHANRDAFHCSVIAEDVATVRDHRLHRSDGIVAAYVLPAPYLPVSITPARLTAHV